MSQSSGLLDEKIRWMSDSNGLLCNCLPIIIFKASISLTYFFKRISVQCTQAFCLCRKYALVFCVGVHTVFLIFFGQEISLDLLTL